MATLALASINDLPNEILEFIFSLVPPYQDLDRCCVVCKRWESLANSEYSGAWVLELEHCCVFDS